jgi:alkanesulfonate monooxygenase SsuD/methylene tetrahydromethanopterin reductase-like flavin-dependent oxidoreductase (luciferase family)
MTFRQPAMLAKMAASVDALSGGRLDLGVGAGWYRGEHEMFGIDYPPYSTRLEMLDEGTQVIKALWSGQPTSFEGKHYRLEQAETYPTPVQASPTIIMGGKGKKTLQLVARHASEWNCAYSSVDLFREKSAELDANCIEIGRDPSSLARSLMIPFVIGQDDPSIQRHIDAHRAIFPSLPADLAGWLAAGYIGGSPHQVVDQLGVFVEAGVARFMLQQNDLDDLDSLALLAERVMPHL